MVWVGYPQSNAISMTDVNGITVFGGTYPAEIWHSLYANAPVPCVDITPPTQKVSWTPFFGQYTASPARLRGRPRRWEFDAAAGQQPRLAAITQTPTRRVSDKSPPRPPHPCRRARRPRVTLMAPPSATALQAVRGAVS